VKKSRGQTQIRKIIEHRYSSHSNIYDYSLDRLQKIRRLLPETGKLLEIGAWDGTTGRFYKTTFKGKLYGIDISTETFKYAKKYFDELKECDLNSEKIPFPDNFFDVVICSEVIEHIYNTDRLLIEIKRILKPSGILIISTPNLASFFNRIFILFGFQPLATEVSAKVSTYGNKFRKNLLPSGHIRNFTYKAFRDIIINNGFYIIKKKASSISNNRIIKFIENFLGSISIELGSDIILKCQIKNK